MRRKPQSNAVLSRPPLRNQRPQSTNPSLNGLSAFLIVTLLTTTAIATDGFEDGSFGDNPSTTPEQTSQTEADDGFGGSFGDDAAQEPGQQTESGAEPENDDEFGGSFGDDADVDNDPGPKKETVETKPSDPDDQFADEGNIETQPPEGSPERETAPETDVGQTQPDETTSPERTDVQQGPDIDPGVLAFETREFGVPPTNKLRASSFHAPTPTSIPGGQLVTTRQLAGALQSGQQLIIIDVLGASYALPNAYSAPGMASPGSFQDRTQQQTSHWLGQITGNNPTVPIVFACSDPFCWLSYNASLRAIAAGYQNVFWYRGGHQAWTMAGFQLSSSGF